MLANYTSGSRKVSKALGPEFSERFAFFIRGFSDLIFHFLKRNFYIFSSFNLDNVLINPKLLLFKYFNTTKYFSRFLTPALRPKFKRVTSKVLSKVLYILNRNKKFKLSSLDPNYFLSPKAFLYKKQVRSKNKVLPRKRALKSVEARMDSYISSLFESKPEISKPFHTSGLRARKLKNS